MFKDYQFFSINLQDAARQILEAQKAQAKQYLLEYDPNARKPMPGYTYDEQEPEFRSDEDAEKTKEWYSSVTDKDEASWKDPRTGKTQVKSAEVDAYGRPTGVTRQETIDDDDDDHEIHPGFPERVWDPGGYA